MKRLCTPITAVRLCGRIVPHVCGQSCGHSAVIATFNVKQSATNLLRYKAYTKQLLTDNVCTQPVLGLYSAYTQRAIIFHYRNATRTALRITTQPLEPFINISRCRIFPGFITSWKIIIKEFQMKTETRNPQGEQLVDCRKFG